jgi:hypothetical protein
MPAQRPRLAITGPMLRGSGELHIVGRRDVTTIADPDGVVHRLLGLADGWRSTAAIFAALAPDFPGLREEQIEDAVAALESIGVLEDSAPVARFLAATAGPRHGDEPALFAGPVRVI